MNKMQAQVREFHQAMDIPVLDSPQALHIKRTFLRISLINEEFREFQEAAGSGDLVETIDSLCDLLYVVFGSAIEAGIDIEPFFDAVHESNMLKVGGPVRPDGKILKPEGWRPPDIAKVFRETYGYDIPKLEREAGKMSG